MGKYRIVEVDQLYGIHEEKTGQIVTKTHILKKAKRLCDRLNVGSGFNGDTPTFFKNQSMLECPQ